MTTDPDTIRGHLTDLPDLCALLPDALITRQPQGTGSRPVPGPAAPIKLHILDILDTRDKGRGADWELGMDWVDPERVGVLPYLWGWVRDLEACAYDTRPDLPPDTPETPTVSSCCTWLLSQLDWAATLPQWPELADGITTTHRRVRDAVAHLRDHREAVPCTKCGTPLERVPGTRPTWQCPSCWHLVTVQAVTLRQAATILGVPERKLRRWALRRGVLTPIAADSGTRRLYDLGQVRALVAEIRLRPAG